MTTAPTCKDCGDVDAWWEGLCRECKRLLDERRIARGWRCFRTPCDGRWRKTPEGASPRETYEAHDREKH